MNEPPPLRTTERQYTLLYTMHTTECQSSQRMHTTNTSVLHHISVHHQTTFEDTRYNTKGWQITPCIHKYNNFCTIFCVPQDGLKMNQKMWNKSRSCYKQRLWTLMVDWSNSIQTEWITVLHMFYAMLCKERINYFLFYFSSQCTLELLSISTSYPTTRDT